MAFPSTCVAPSGACVLALLLPVQSSSLIKKERNGHRISRMTVARLVYTV
jgi:hypothetical protein